MNVIIILLLSISYYTYFWFSSSFVCQKAHASAPGDSLREAEPRLPGARVALPLRSAAGTAGGPGSALGAWRVRRGGGSACGSGGESLGVIKVPGVDLGYFFKLVARLETEQTIKCMFYDWA